MRFSVFASFVNEVNNFIRRCADFMSEQSE